jgi:hypothetical protein
MSLRGFRNLSVFALVVVGIAVRSDASTTFTVPPGLSPGTLYRLVFVTDTTTDATSNSIGFYNNLVTLEADSVPALAALGATWTVIGSTEAVSAATNIGTTTSGIYRLDGNEVAPNTAALFNAVSVNLLNPVNIDSQGDQIDFNVWTGTNPNGTIATGSALGDTNVCAGNDGGIDVNFLHAGSCTFFASNVLNLYAISSELTVAPEPQTIGLTMLGVTALLLARKRKQRDVTSPNRDAS